jgi:hypothetical protein
MACCAAVGYWAGRMPVGGPNGGPLQVSLSQAQFDELSTELFQKARLPLDQACWTAGECRLLPGWKLLISASYAHHVSLLEGSCVCMVQAAHGHVQKVPWQPQLHHSITCSCCCAWYVVRC